MNYLELCQRVRQESGISGTGPTTVLGQQGQLGKITEWVRASWLEIQTHREDWGFMWRTLSFDTVLNQDAYTTGTTDIKTVDYIKIYETSKGVPDESIVGGISYSQMRSTSKIGTEQSGRPEHYSIRPDKAIVFSPTPVAVHTAVIDYYKEPQILTENTDTPGIPPSLHDLIVYKALMMFSAHYEATMQYQHAVAQYEKLFIPLEQLQLPRMTTTGPLA
jgi:hypothetical protein